MSRCLADRSIDHIVLERGEVANSWKTERWESLRLLTPNWQSRLPGFGYEGDDPDGFRTMPETIEFLERYARAITAPVQTQTRVTSVRPREEGYVVATTQGDWECRTVVLASGACNVPQVPSLSESVPRSIATLTPFAYRNPEQIEKGGVLVVGASATGIQIAEELQRSGRPVTLSVGEHVRVPRVYRGRDITWWMDKAGVFDEGYDQVDDIVRARNVPSFQLAGSPERQTLDLNALTQKGVKLVGRLAGLQRRKSAVLGLAPQRVRSRGSQDEPPSRPHRPMGGGERARRRFRPAASLRAYEDRNVTPARSRPRPPRDPDHPLGDGLSS